MKKPVEFTTRTKILVRIQVSPSSGNVLLAFDDEVVPLTPTDARRIAKALAEAADQAVVCQPYRQDPEP